MLSTNQMANYTNGPCLKFPRKASRLATFQQIQDACTVASARLGNGYRLEPEAITEGGFLFADWPGKQPGQYKSVRFFNLKGRWPTISNGTAGNGPTGMASSIGPDSRNRIALFLKAFYGAPAFTRAEVVAVAESLAACYNGCRVTHVPSDKQLKREYSADMTGKREMVEKHEAVKKARV